MTKLTTLSESDYQCLQMGRSIMLVGMKRAQAILAEQINLTQQQLHSTEVELKTAVNGISELKPSMKRTMELVRLGTAAVEPAAEEAPPVRRKYTKRSNSGIKGYWASMTAEERAAEMARRKAVTRGDEESAKKPAMKRLVQPNHPRNENHPKHKQWLAKMRRANRRSWDALTPLARQQRIGAALAGRKAKAAR
jgi:hypothetical protein